MGWIKALAWPGVPSLSLPAGPFLCSSVLCNVTDGQGEGQCESDLAYIWCLCCVNSHSIDSRLHLWYGWERTWGGRDNCFVEQRDWRIARPMLRQCCTWKYCWVEVLTLVIVMGRCLPSLVQMSLKKPWIYSPLKGSVDGWASLVYKEPLWPHLRFH